MNSVTSQLKNLLGQAKAKLEAAPETDHTNGKDGKPVTQPAKPKSFHDKQRAGKAKDPANLPYANAVATGKQNAEAFLSTIRNSFLESNILTTNQQ